ncbi:MAG: hypothetical protein RL661_121, partial [Pseudomonadota bacterium]
RSSAGATVTLSLSGPVPERITLRYPGVRRAMADGVPCAIEGDLIFAPCFRQLSIEA